jgi:hypothetical protein
MSRGVIHTPAARITVQLSYCRPCCYIYQLVGIGARKTFVAKGQFKNLRNLSRAVNDMAFMFYQIKFYVSRTVAARYVQCVRFWTTRTLKLRVRIQLEALMYIRIFLYYVALCRSGVFDTWGHIHRF